ncbi:MAG: adenosylcobinamide-GDP ribazoletransferase [Sporomusaceae bacterium]|jgi:adenosylcobinamide-GDP ribazoletransferase|nr:adenosylcobinamide-GDP ribazoletransferase [Sporomusaceae bacterium]
MKHFITALQFLTRIRIFNEQDWSPAGFGQSVKFFPLVGAVIGIFLALFAFLLQPYLPVHVFSALLLAWWLFLTGVLCLDGLMDTADGVFSGRERAKMLDIMKDSRVGANGVIAFGFTLLLKFALLLDLPPQTLLCALFVTPVTSRAVMAWCVFYFPYAREAGIGKAFKEFAGKNTGMIAALLALALIAPWGKTAFLSAFGGICCAFFIAWRAQKVLGALTGDVYGAVTECCEIVTLFFFLLWSNWI